MKGIVAVGPMLGLYLSAALKLASLEVAVTFDLEDDLECELDLEKY